MKKLEIKTEKATLLVLDLNKWIENIRISSFGNIVFDNPYIGWYNIDLDEVPLGYKHLGKLYDITEYVWKGIVDAPVEHKIHSYNPLLTKRYFRFKDYQSDADILKTATGSGLSLLKANGVDENWYNPHVFIKVERGN